MADAEEMHREQPFCFHAVARFEHADPEAVVVLIAVKPVGRLGDRGIELLWWVLQRPRGGIGHRRLRSPRCCGGALSHSRPAAPVLRLPERSRSIDGPGPERFADAG